MHRRPRTAASTTSDDDDAGDAAAPNSAPGLPSRGSPGRWLDPPTLASSSGEKRNSSSGGSNRSSYHPALPPFFAGAKSARFSTISTPTTSSDNKNNKGRSSWSTNSTAKTMTTTTTPMRDAAISVLYQLVFWPLTLTMMLLASTYRFLLRVGCYGSRLRRDPPRHLVRLVAAPFRLINPPLPLGIENLVAALGCDGGAGAGGAAAAVAREESGGSSSRGRRQGHVGRTAGRAEGAVTAADDTRGDAAAAAAADAAADPVLLVGNQSLLGLDHMAMLDEVQGTTGVYPCLLYDTLFGFVPGVKQLLEAAGGATGTAGNCEALMSAGQCLLLYPGGAGEAFKGGEADKYKLMWHEKLGFVRLAVKHGYALLPFASVGVEDAVSVAFGLDVTWLAGKAESKWTTCSSGGDGGGSGGGGCTNRLKVPFLFPYNSFERQYFAFGGPIETAHLGGDWENAVKCLDVYTKVKNEVEHLIAQLQDVQRRDPDRYVLRRVWRGFRRMVGGLQDNGVPPLRGDL